MQKQESKEGQQQETIAVIQVKKMLVVWASEEGLESG